MAGVVIKKGPTKYKYWNIWVCNNRLMNPVSTDCDNKWHHISVTNNRQESVVKLVWDAALRSKTQVN